MGRVGTVFRYLFGIFLAGHGGVQPARAAVGAARGGGGAQRAAVPGGGG